MNSQNLVPIANSEQARAMGRVGGSKRTENKRIAARIRELKKKGLTDDSAQHLLNIFEDAGYSLFDQAITLQKILSQCNTVSEKNAVEKTIQDWHKMHHGTKTPDTLVQNQNNTQVIINVIRPEQLNRELHSDRKTD